jgi:CRP-like cAMP-binding protein
MDPRELLGMIAFFSEALNGDEIFALAAGARRRTYPPGGAMIRENDPPTSLFVIESGRVSVAVEGEKQPLATLFAGDFVGEMSLLTGAPANATVMALEPVVAYEIGPDTLAPVLASSPALDDRLAATMEKRQGELDHLYGNPAWGLNRLGHAELLSLIRKFYSDHLKPA